MSRHVVYVSFYSDVYKLGADNLRIQLDALGIPNDIRHFNKKDWDWQRYVRYKPQFILERMEAHPEADAIVWVDSDACVWAKSPIFWTTEAELGVHFQPIPAKGVSELLSGTMYWRNTAKVRKAVATWIEAMKTAPKQLKKPEQQMLHNMLPRLKLTLELLEREDCMISRVVEGEYQRRRGTRIAHNQWSRKFRADNSAGQTPPPGVPVPGRSRSRKRRRNPRERTVRPGPAKAVAIRPGEDVIGARRGQLNLGKDAAAQLQLERRHKILARRNRKKRLDWEAKRKKTAPEEPEIPESAPLPPTSYKPTGGLTHGEKATPEEIRRAHEAMAKIPKAELLDGECKDAPAIIIMGNSWSLAKDDLTPLAQLPVVGCNRALRPPEGWKAPLFTPNYICFGDREAYCQERDTGALAAFAKKGGRVLLSDSIFDPQINNSGRKSGDDYAMCQPPPDFPAFMFKFGPRDKKGWTYGHHVAQGLVQLPFNFDSFKTFIVTCQNISGAMLQTAAILGAKVIGCIGIELSWPDDGPSHHYGNGKKLGAWQPGKSMESTLGSFRQAKRLLAERGVKVFNLSPVKNSKFASVWGRHDYGQFVEKYCR